MTQIGEKVILSAQVAATERDRLARLAIENRRSLSGELRCAVDTYLRLAEPREGFPAGSSSAGALPPAMSGSAPPLKDSP